MMAHGLGFPPSRYGPWMELLAPGISPALASAVADILRSELEDGRSLSLFFPLHLSLCL